MQKVIYNPKGYYKIKSKERKKKLFYLLGISFLISILITSLLNLYFLRIFKLKSIANESISQYYFINIFSKSFQLYDEVLVNHPFEDEIKIPAVIFGLPKDSIKIENDKIEIGSKVLFLKNPLPKIFEKKENFTLKENEYYIISEISIDSYEIGVIQRENIIGKVVFKF